MKLALIVAGSIIGILVLVAVTAVLIGNRMPLRHTATRSVLLNRAPSDVYAVVRNFGASPSWRPDVKKVELLGPDKFREHGSNGAVTYQIVEDVPNRRIVTKIVELDLGYSGSWEYTLEESGNGTRVTITEHGEVSNPLFRVMSRYVFGHTATIDAYLKALSESLH